MHSTYRLVAVISYFSTWLWVLFILTMQTKGLEIQPEVSNNVYPLLQCQSSMDLNWFLAPYWDISVLTSSPAPHRVPSESSLAGQTVTCEALERGGGAATSVQVEWMTSLINSPNLLLLQKKKLQDLELWFEGRSRSISYHHSSQGYGRVPWRLLRPARPTSLEQKRR